MSKDLNIQDDFIRGKYVMLDRDIAKLYGVETRDLNKAVKRNLERFPEDFMFRKTRGKKYLLYAFTE
jgi:hypothetical protein